MTHTLPKRTIRTASPRHAPAAEYRGPHCDDHHDAADLAAALRVLALRAHRMMKDARGMADGAARLELRELRGAILSLEAHFQSQNLQGLIPYVRSLRHRVEAQLG